MLLQHTLLAVATLLASAPLSASRKLTAQQVIDELGLEPNIEKGWWTETFRDAELYSNRSVSTAIYYLLEAKDARSYWHRVDKTEVWHYYAGTPMSLYLSSDDGHPVREHVLGPDVLRGQRPQVVIAPWEWQQARSHGGKHDWTLVGTTVAPGFVPEGFELAPPDWKPDGA
ncbi:unnamed protein product [Clonostachys rosea]|uniref:DUF985 domain-containing protein n=1 Tax=Bionectria ochroleuca TaxID=29856 RepID=A0ABY6UUW4_BIOOC|nr:unnamed protein product [Clonostachys rosea]